MNKIACFLTCGYTEAGVMQQFLRKINPNFEYKQYLPNKTIKRKGMPKTIDTAINGLTGEELLNKVYDIISKQKKDVAECSACIIEDDLDGRFNNWTTEQIHGYQQQITDNVCRLLGQIIPVIIMYASPEIESWFMADWNNSFAYVYGKSSVVRDVDTKSRSFYVHHLKRYIDEAVLKRYCNDLTDIEMFCSKEEVYIKLSDLLISAVTTDSKNLICNLSNANPTYVQQILQSRDLVYSKKFHGELMLKQIEPGKIADVCHFYFRDVFYKLQGLKV